MKKSFETYSTLKLNGQFYSRQELLTLSEAKLDSSTIPDWEKAIYLFIIEWLDEKEEVVVKTSGSTGKPKNILLEKQRMVSSAKATNAFFNLDENSKALLCLSAEYIAGKMMIIRAFVGAFDLYYKEPTSDALLHLETDFDFTAVVPMQMGIALKKENITPLNRIKKMIIGGAALREDLKESLDSLETDVWATYGMTETITHIALQRLNGKHKTEYFQALPNVKFDVDEKDCLRISAPNINSAAIQTNDKVELLDDQRFRFLGRVDFVINSGGIKLSPEILEQKMALHIGDEFAFSSKLDAILGEKLVLVIEGRTYSKEKLNELDKILQSKLDRFEQPKEILFVQELPETSSGKLDRISMKKMLT